MFVTSNQFFVFLSCFTFGVMAGIMFSISQIVHDYNKNAIIKGVLDFTAFIFTLVFFFIYSFSNKFPSFRIYMVFGVFLGILAYMKSFHIILAKIVKKIYNKVYINKREKRRCQQARKKKTKRILFRQKRRES